MNRYLPRSFSKVIIYCLVFIGIISCADGSKNGRKVSSLQTEFAKSGDVVLDLKTGLEWQDNSEVGGHAKSWQEAKTYCDNLNLQGSGKWRLPSKSELFGLVTNGRPTISKNTVFENIGWYSNWSSTIENTHDVWEVNLEYVIGHALDTRLNKAGVRCVRGR